MNELKRLIKHPVSTLVGVLCLMAGGYVAYYNKELDMWSGGLFLFGAVSVMGKDPKFIRKFLGIDKDEDLQ